MINFIYDPELNKNINLHSTRAQTVVNNYLNMLGGRGDCGYKTPTKRCVNATDQYPDDERCDRSMDSGRCRKSTRSISTESIPRPQAHPQAKPRPRPQPHPQAKPRPRPQPRPQARPQARPQPKHPTKDDMFKTVTTKKKGKTRRLSAGDYYREHGDSAVGDICDIRNDGELRCLLLRKNGVPYWAKPSKSGIGQEICQPWNEKCRI